MTHYREATVGAAISTNLTAMGASATVKATARRPQTKPAWVSLGAFLMTATAVTLALQHPEHRCRVGSAAGTPIDTLEGVMARNTNARLAQRNDPSIGGQRPPMPSVSRRHHRRHILARPVGCRCEPRDRSWVLPRCFLIVS